MSPHGGVVLHLFLFTVSTLLAGLVTGWGFLNRDRRAAVHFTAYSLCVTVMNATVVGQILAPLAWIPPIHYVEQAATVLLTVSWLYFTLRYTGYGVILDKLEIKFVLGAVVGGMLLFSSVPPFVQQATSREEVVTSPFTIISWADTTLTDMIEILGLTFVAVGAFALAYRLLTAGYTRSWQSITVVGAISFNILFEFFDGLLIPFQQVPGVEYSSIATALVSAVYVVVLYRYDLFGYRPVAETEVIKAVKDPVLVINPDHRIIQCNDRTKSVFTEVEIGESAEAALPSAIANHDLIRNLESGYDQVTITVGDDTRHYNMHVATLDAMGDDHGVAVTLRDVTELEQRTRELEQQTEQLDQFASIVSHDLRNPLTVAETYLMNLNRKTDSEEVEVIQESLDRMEVIIDDALTLARHGQVIEEREPVEISTTARHAWQMSTTRQADLECDIPDSTVVPADADRLTTLFENLYRNSVDHGPDDVTIRTGLIGGEETVENADGFYVEDTGPGIPEEKRSRVFDQGYSTSDDGTGLGLAIVKSIVEAHNWTVDVQESPEGGARFEFTQIDIQSASDTGAKNE